MLKHSLTGLACLCLSNCSQGNVGTVELSSIWYEYARAVDAQRGKNVVDLVSSDTIQHYEFLNTSALKGVRARDKLTITDEVAIRFLRAQHKRETLLKLSGRDTLRLLVRNGIVAIPDMTKFQFGEVTSTKTTATASIQTTDPSTDYEVGFDLEHGKWRIDDTPLRDSREWVLAMRLIQYGGDRDKIVIELAKGAGVTDAEMDDIYKPMNG